jgi:hypothetical protein
MCQCQKTKSFPPPDSENIRPCSETESDMHMRIDNLQHMVSLVTLIYLEDPEGQ